MCFTGSSTKEEAPKPAPSRPRPQQQSKPAPQQNGQQQQQRPVAPIAGKPSGGHARHPSSGGTSLPTRTTSTQAWGKDGYIVKGSISTHEGATMKLMQVKKTKELVAAKWIPRVVGQGLTKNTEREIVNHRKLLHPNIIRFKEVFMTDECLVIVMEYASGGPLNERLKTSGRLPEADAKKFFGQLIDGVAYCHGQGIFHRDLRMENLLLQGSFYDSVLKISNFGYSKSAVLDSVAVTLGLGGGGQGQVLYSAPELMLGNPAKDGYDGAAVDIWSSAICLYNMLFGIMPFLDPEMPNVMNAKVNQRIIRAQYEIPSSVHISREALDLLSKLFVSDPKKRITAPQIQQHPWLSGAELAVPEPPEEVAAAPQSEDDIRAVVARAHKRRQESQAKLEAQGSLDAPGLGRVPNGGLRPGNSTDSGRAPDSL